MLKGKPLALLLQLLIHRVEFKMTSFYAGCLSVIIYTMEQEVFLKKFSWDGEEGREELLIRAMLYANPLEIAPLFRKEELRRVFLNNLHRFRGKDRSFWKVVLDVSEEELKRYSEKNFRENSIFIPY